MKTEIVRNQYVISLRNGMIAYIVADSLEQIAGGIQNNKFFNTKEQMMVNTADIVAIMSPQAWEEQKRYQRGWYQQGLNWYNKKGECEEETYLGSRLGLASDSSKKISDKASAEAFLQKLKERELYDSFKRYYSRDLENAEAFLIENTVTIDTSGIVKHMKL